MRKILMIIIIVLLGVLVYNILANGLEIGSLKILSIREIEDNSKELKRQIEDINTLIDQSYPQKINELNEASKNLQNSKEEYLKYTNLSSDEEIIEAMQNKSYAIEFLWAKIGTHARDEGINLKLEIVKSSTGANNVDDLNFTVYGSYIGITNFIYSLENDTDLNFTIENFKLLPYQGASLQGTFVVRNIGIEGNTSNKNTTTSQPSGTNTNEQTETNEVNQNQTTETSQKQTNANVII